MQEKSKRKQLMEGEEGMVSRTVRLGGKERWINIEIPLVEKVKMERAKIK